MMAGSTMLLRPRYHRWLVDLDTDSLETNTGYATLEWRIPRSRAAVVLVDVWDHHYLKDTEARAEEIIQRRIRPLIAECRRSGLELIHAPSPPQAEPHPAWVGREALSQAEGGYGDWPPEDFRSKKGEYAVFAKPAEPREKLIEELRASRQIHPQVRPEGGEIVVATGEELHQYCAKRGILFLFYLGFNTNACILMRDYGTLAMSRRGYEVVILRDCTTGMESPDTQPTLGQTKGAILFLEMFGKYSLTSEELLEGLGG